jgi:hypothetical protein
LLERASTIESLRAVRGAILYVASTLQTVIPQALWDIPSHRYPKQLISDLSDHALRKVVIWAVWFCDVKVD